MAADSEIAILQFVFPSKEIQIFFFSTISLSYKQFMWITFVSLIVTLSFKVKFSMLLFSDFMITGVEIVISFIFVLPFKNIVGITFFCSAGGVFV